MDTFKNSRLNGKEWIIVACLYFSAFASLLPDEINRLALYGALPLAFCICFKEVRTLKVNGYLWLLILLYLWDFISSFWARYHEPASIELKRVLGAFLVSYIFAVCSRKNHMIPWMYGTFVVLYIGAWYYASNHIVIDIEAMGGDEDRLNDNKLNANHMAYYTFFVTYLLFLLGEILKRKTIVKYLFFAMLPLSFFVALTTASRQVLIIQIPLFCVLFYLRYYKKVSSSKKFMFTLIAGVGLMFCLPYALNLYEGSYLAERASMDLNEDSRTKLLENAIEVGIEHFPLGVGAGNYAMYSFNRHISHISYAELFANNGIVGLWLYLVLLFKFVKRQWTLYKASADKIHLLFIIFGVFFVVDNMFYVMYIDIWLISFFILVASHSLAYSETKGLKL